MTRITFAALAVAALLFSVGFRLTHPVVPACGVTADRATANARPVVAFGDSITWGWGIPANCLNPSDEGDVRPALHLQGPRDETYPAVLSRTTGRLVLNYGWPGEQTSAGLARLPGVIRAAHPSTVLLLEGVNDILHGHRSPAQIVRNLQLMIRVAHTRVVVATLLPVYGEYAWARPEIWDTNARIRRLRGVRVVDLAQAFAGRRDLLGPDGVHPTVAGARVMARRFAEMLR